MYHMHRPLKNHAFFFFPLGHLFHFLEMEQPFLCTHSSRLLGQCLAHPGCAVVGNTLSRSLLESLYFLFFPWNMCAPVTSHPNLLILQDSNTSLQEALPHSPCGRWFCSHGCLPAPLFSIFHSFPYQQRSAHIPYLPNSLLVPVWGAMFFLPLKPSSVSGTKQSLPAPFLTV